MSCIDSTLSFQNNTSLPLSSVFGADLHRNLPRQFVNSDTSMYEANYSNDVNQGEGASPNTSSASRRAPWEEYNSRLDALGVTDFLQEQPTPPIKRQQNHLGRHRGDENQRPSVDMRELRVAAPPQGVKSILKKTTDNGANRGAHPINVSSLSAGSDHLHATSTPAMTPVHAQHQTLPSVYSSHLNISQHSPPPFFAEGPPQPPPRVAPPPASSSQTKKSVFEEAANLQLSRAVERMRQASRQPNVSKDEVSALLQEVEDVLEHNMSAMQQQPAPQEDRWAPSPAHPFCYDADGMGEPENMAAATQERPSPVAPHREGLFRSLDGEFNPSSSTASLHGKREDVAPPLSPSHSPSPAKEGGTTASFDVKTGAPHWSQQQQQQQQQQQMQWYYTYCAWMQYYQHMYAHAYQQNGTYPFHSYPPRAASAASPPPSQPYASAVVPSHGVPDTSRLQLTLQELQQQQSMLCERISLLQSQLTGQGDATREEEGEKKEEEFLYTDGRKEVAKARPRRRRASAPRKPATHTVNAAYPSPPPRRTSSRKGRSRSNGGGGGGGGGSSGTSKNRSTSSSRSYHVNQVSTQSSAIRSEELKGERLSVYERKRRELATQRPSWKF